MYVYVSVLAVVLRHVISKSYRRSDWTLEKSADMKSSYFSQYLHIVMLMMRGNWNPSDFVVAEFWLMYIKCNVPSSYQSLNQYWWLGAEPNSLFLFNTHLITLLGVCNFEIIDSNYVHLIFWNVQFMFKCAVEMSHLILSSY